MQFSFDYSQWTAAELARAEATACEFLSQNSSKISQVLGRQCDVLDGLVAVLKNPNLTIEQRLDCLARIADASEGLQNAANGFFELGSQPLVARVLAKADLP